MIDTIEEWDTPVLPPTQFPVARGWSNRSVSTSALTAVAIDRSRCRMLALSSWVLDIPGETVERDTEKIFHKITCQFESFIRVMIFIVDSAFV